MSRKLWCVVLVATTLALASTGHAVVVGDFEGSFDGWYEDAATLSLSTTGATLGTQALQVDGPGGWKINAKLDVKPHLATLAKKGVKITADVTAFGADMSTDWMQVEMIINGQDNDDNGANNNIGWNQLGAQDVVRDGQPHTYTWELPDELTAKIAGADGTISWFEFALVTNLDEGSVTKFYIDNIQIVYEEPTSDVLVSSFETGLEGWYTDDWTAGTTAVSTIGATHGVQSMQVEGPGGWQQLTKVDAKPYRTLLAVPGAVITADVTAFAADMTTEWMQVGMVLNCQNNDNNGANNNLGWNELGLQDVARDGQPQTLTWVIPEDLAARIAGTDDSIGWFEFLLISNVDEASVAKFYIDNIRVAGIPVDTGKATDFILGNWEQDLDRWVVGGTADVRYSDTNGVTLDSYSLDVYTPTGEWANALELNLLEPNNADILAAFRANTKITADITHLVVDWPVGDIPPWNGTHLIINTDAGYLDLGYRAGWNQNDGDRTDSITWDYSQQLGQIDFDNVTYLQLLLVVNANSQDYEGWVWFYIDNMKLTGGGIALNPQPASGATDVDVETELSWDAGAFATSHNLYLGTSSAAVAAADGDSDPNNVLFVPVDGASFDPNGLEFNTQYFWRVDSVNDVNPDSPWRGVVWDFTTANFIIVDDFESYTNDAEAMERVFQTWIDGLGYTEPAPGVEGNGTGSILGYDPAFGDIMERTIVHGGLQSVALEYGNADAPFVSEIVRTFDEPQDWTINGFNTLRLSVYGRTGNGADQLYVTLEDSQGNTATLPLGGPEAVTTEAWMTVGDALSSFAAQGVDVASVAKMTVGVGDRTNPMKGAGTILLDDVEVGFSPVGLVAHYALENNLEDSSGNGHHGTLAGDPNFPAVYVSGPAGFGQGMLFDGTGGHQNVELGTFNPSAATGKLTVALWAKWEGPTDQWQGLIGKRDSWAVDDMLWDIEIHRDQDTIAFRRIDSYPGSGGRTLPVGVWTHVAVTFDGTTARFYIDGEETGNGNFSFGQDTEAALHFGSGDPNGGNAFNGALDEVRLYDIVLTDAEILELAGR